MLGAAVQYRLRQRMFAAALQRTGLLQQRGLVAINGVQVNDARLAGRERSGLVEGDRCHGMGDLQRFSVLDQNTVARGDTGASHDRSGRRKAKRTGTGDDQHGNRIDQRHLGGRANEQPARQGQQGNHQHRRDEHLTDLVHQFLDRCLSGLRVFDQADDACQHRFAAEGRGAYQQPAFTVDRAAGDAVAQSLRHRQAFTADQGLVGLAFAFDHFAVNRKTFTGLDQHQVVQTQDRNRYLFFSAVDHTYGAIGPERLQCTNGCAGLAFGTAF